MLTGNGCVYVADLYTVDFVDKLKYIMCVGSL